MMPEPPDQENTIMIANTAADIGLIIIAVGFFLVCVFACYALLNSARVLESTKEMIDGVKDETVPLLGEVKTTVTSVNKELERADGIMESTGNIVKSAERLTDVVEKTVSSPLIKLVTFGAGAAKAMQKFVGSSGSE
jgi:uncharacterized protein YoxC